MNPTLKKALTAVAAKQVIEKINERRRPQKPSFFARFGKLLLIGGGVGAAYVAYKSGRVQPLLDKIKGNAPGTGSSTASSNGSGEGDEITFRSENDPAGAPVG